MKITLITHFILVLLITVLCVPICLGQNTVSPNGYNVFYYENGNISSEGTMRNGKPDGYWKAYYTNNVIKSEGNRKNYFIIREDR